MDSGRRPSLRVALLATFTLDPLLPYVGVGLEDLGLPAELHIGPFDQIAQECLATDSATARFRPDMLVVWMRCEDLWRGQSLPLIAPAASYTSGADELADAALSATRRWGASLVVVLPTLPEHRPLGLGDACSGTGVAATATAVRESLRSRLSGEAGVLILDAEEVIRQLGTARSYDPRMLVHAHIPYSEPFHARLGQELARLIRLSRVAAPKVVVVDGDNTLWGGVVGEDGAERVDLADGGPGRAHRDFQTFLLELRRAGVLLALCSKNRESDVWAVFDRPEMVLRREDLAAHRIDWNRKSTNLLEIADELNVGVGSVVFIDDNPAEIAEVQAALPEVSCILMPTDPAGWLSSIQGAGVLDRLPPTREDLDRPQYYAQEVQRRNVQRTAPSAVDYLAQLGVTVRIVEPGSGDLQRFAQLVNKTNQFNLNGRRRDEAELGALIADSRFACRLVAATDRFGDYGVVGAYIVDKSIESAVLDTFVLSCRALGRGIEEAMIAHAFETILPGTQLVATVVELPRNTPARDFFARLGCAPSQGVQELGRLEWPDHVARP